ncbi:MAG: hypothetical protein HZB25_10040 [Candidatus Eisenbacteria bacterium]|nr:hypothetical protein [Candidatus Eisenbacteria bacterium]
MPRALVRTLSALALVLTWLGWSGASARAAQPGLDPEEVRLASRAGRGTGADSRAPGPRGVGSPPVGIAPQVYEQAAGTGGLHTAGNVWLHVDNTNLSPGNAWFDRGLNRDPGAQWPGPSKAEYLYYSSLWVAAKDDQGARRVDDSDELRGDLAESARTLHAYAGMRGGRRGEDDDADTRVDEDFLNGSDDDGDGRVDEDFGAVSPDMFATEMTDHTPQAMEDGSYTETHVPLGLRVRRTSFAWPTAGASDFVGLHYEITNVTRVLDGRGHALDSVFVGMYWRPTAGPRGGTAATSDDHVGWLEIGADGASLPDTSFKLPSLLPQFSVARAPLSIIHASHADSVMHVFWCADDDGDGGDTPGAGALVLLGATKYPRLGFKAAITPDDVSGDTYGIAPRATRVNSFRLFYPSIPYDQGGRPVTDAERWDAMTEASRQLRAFPAPTATGSYRALFSTGPFLALPADSSIEFDVAVCVGRADYDLSVPMPRTWDDRAGFRRKMGDLIPKTEFDPHPQSLLEACQEAWKVRRGRYKANTQYNKITYFPPEQPSASTSCRNPGSDPSSLSYRNAGQRGREVCVMGERGRTIEYFDCRDVNDEIGVNYRRLDPFKCTWFDLDCDMATGTCDSPVGANYTGNHLVDQETWNASLPPVLPRLRTVAGDRSVEVLWDDLAEQVPNPVTGMRDFVGYRLYRAAGWKRDAATGVIGPNTDLWQLVGWWATEGSVGQAAPLDSARNPAFPEDRYDSTAVCPVPGCRAHPVGYYHFVDRDVANGFRYFYAVTAYSETRSDMLGPEAGKVSRGETALAAVESTVVSARTDCAGDPRGVKVVPNPYRFRAAWDLRPSSDDPTGTHVNFNHLPCGRFTLSIYTAAGDLVQRFHETDTRRSGTVEWNLVSRNGQDVRGGIYVYAVESGSGSFVGRFTVIR